MKKFLVLILLFSLVFILNAQQENFIQNSDGSYSVFELKKTSGPIWIENDISLDSALKAYHHPGKKIDSVKSYFNSSSKEKFFLDLQKREAVSYIIYGGNRIQKKVEELPSKDMGKNYPLISIVGMFSLISLLLPWRKRIGIRLALTIISGIIIVSFILLMYPLFDHFLEFLFICFVLLVANWMPILNHKLAVFIVSVVNFYWIFFCFFVYSGGLSKESFFLSTIIIVVLHFLSWGVMNLTTKNQVLSTK